MTRFESVIPVLRMFDIARTRAFYLDFLGGSVVFEHRFAPDLPLYLRVALNGVALDLSEHYGDSAPGARVMIATRGIVAFQEALLARQARFARPGLERQDWGATTMTLTDPSFNRLVFWEESPEGSHS